MSVTLRRIVYFFLLSYAFTWFGWLGNYLAPSDYWLLPMNPLGPLMAAPLVIWMTEGGAGVKAWWRRLGKFRAPVGIYAAACLVPLGIIFASMLSVAATGAVMLPLPEIALADFFVAIPIILLFGPLPEEVSFRGYGQVSLQREMSPLATALLIGVGVLIWHTPLILIGDLAWPWMICIVAVSVVYAWLYNSGGSVWPLVLLHFTVNYFGGEFLGKVVSDPHTQVIYASFYCLFYSLWAAVIVWRTGASLGRDRHPNLIPATA